MSAFVFIGLMVVYTACVIEIIGMLVILRLNKRDPVALALLISLSLGGVFVLFAVYRLIIS